MAEKSQSHNKEILGSKKKHPPDKNKTVEITKETTKKTDQVQENEKVWCPKFRKKITSQQ